MAIITYVYLVAAFLIADSFQSEFLTCSGQPAPKNVNIVGCNKLPCDLKRGTFADAAIDFTVLASTKTLRPVVDVQIGNAHSPYPLPEQNACKSLANGECPLDKGEVVTYKLKMPIEKIYPKIFLTIQLSLVDEHNNPQVCLKIPGQVVD
ncbi:NPC intracellular cholesterol transporter 2 [Nomia melanderi]|uniref:NPC intracellular cholesterol transporter 2 n=1 Tax=Nomia melanderi TaxID=2448451 RepID=UPI001303F766|nr:NPC intracellular cholesterol transporter 2-like [Nomia melanderi]